MRTSLAEPRCAGGALSICVLGEKGGRLWILAELTAHLVPDGPTQRAEPTSRIRQANDANLGIGTL